MMCFEWMSHGEMDLPLRMVALWCPRVSRGRERDGGWANMAIGGGGAGLQGAGEGGRGPPAIPAGILSLAAPVASSWKQRGGAICTRQLGVLGL